MAIRLSTGLINATMSTSSFKSALEGASGFLIDIYSGTQPANPDTAASGTLLVTVSLGGTGAGMHFEDAAVAGVLLKDAAETWSGEAVATGTAGWWRLRRTSDTGTGASTTASRMDGSIGTSGADMNQGTLTVTTGAPFLIPTAEYILPAA